MKISEVLNCSFSSWYPKFKDHTIRSYIVPVPQEFVDYLLQDGVVLPEGTITASSQGDEREEEDNRNEDVVDWTTEDILTPEAEPPSFPEFEAMIKNRLRRLENKVFPKLNWSAPRDATWISFDKTLKCTCPCDIYLLLKSSQFITHDLTQPFLLCDDDENLKNETKVSYELVLRKWQEFNPAYEFRVFVKNDQVVGISQRHNDMHYPFIGERKEEIVADIQSFFYHVIRGNFPDKHFVFDVYRRNQGKLLLIDFNPFGEVTDGLLFNWEELETIDKASHGTDQEPAEPRLLPVFRYVEEPSGVQPNPYGTYAVPQDFVDLATGEDPLKLIDFLKLKVQQQDEEEDSSDDEEDSHTFGT